MYEVPTNLSMDELRAVVKSLSIGCDQMLKKLERVQYTKWQDSTSSEYGLLMSAKHKLEQSLMKGVSE